MSSVNRVGEGLNVVGIGEVTKPTKLLTITELDLVKSIVKLNYSKNPIFIVFAQKFFEIGATRGPEGNRLPSSLACTAAGTSIAASAVALRVE